MFLSEPVVESPSITFIGITAVGGAIPTTNRYQASAYRGLLDNVLASLPLAEKIENDNDGGDLVDVPYEVTLALRNVFSLTPGETQSFTTQTIFGNAIPPTPGSLQTLPLRPSDNEPPFVYELEPADIDESETIWLDPEIAVGYSYEVSGAEFDSVTARR